MDSDSHPVIMELIGKHVVGTKEAARIIKQPILQQEPNSIQVFLTHFQEKLIYKFFCYRLRVSGYPEVVRILSIKTAT